MDQITTIENAVGEFLSGNKIYTEYENQWQYLYESYLGGEDYKNAQHLVKYQLETAGEYAARLRSAVLENHCTSVIAIYSSFLFRNPPQRSWANFENMPEIDQFLVDADKDGRSFDNFMKDCSTYSSVFGHVWCVVSKPNVNATTRAQEIAMGVRPYVSMLTPLVVLDWKYERAADGHYHLDYFKYIEDVNGNIKTLKEWTPDIIRTTIVDSENLKVKETIVEENQLGHLPIVCIYNKRSLVRGVGISDISDIADAQRFIYNMVNEIDQSVRLDSHPSLAKTENTLAGAGAGSIIQMPDDLDPGLKPFIVQATGGNIQNILASIEHTVESIDKQANIGAVRTTAARNMSGVAMETEFSLLNARLSEKGTQLALAEEEIFKHFGHYYALEWEGMTIYPDTFNIRNRHSDLDMLLKAATAPVNSTEYKREVARQIAAIIVDEENKELVETINSEIETATNTFTADLNGNTG